MIPRPDRRRVSVRYPERRRILKNSPRRGNVLILFAMMLFGLMALAALVIDIGFARLAQKQMQSAVDSAAIEGLRFRDYRKFPSSESTSMSLDGRERASDLAEQTFSPDPSVGYEPGAGPIVGFSGGEGSAELFASQQIEIPEVPFYRPVDVDGAKLRTNQANAIEGDMVSGRYTAEPRCENPSAWIVRHFHREGPPVCCPDAPDGPCCQEWIDCSEHEDNSDVLEPYFRPDFVPDSLGDSFLVRMRRSGEEFEDEVGSAGPSLPVLFGRGSFVNREFVRRGITARATGIAQARPAVVVGPEIRQSDLDDTIPPGSPNDVVVMEGVIPVAFRFDDWEGLREESMQIVSSVTNAVIGEPVNVEENGEYEDAGYCIVFDSLPSSGIDVVIGFGWHDPSDASRATSTVAVSNATSLLSAAWPQLEGLSESDRQFILDRHREFSDPLLAPVSVR